MVASKVSQFKNKNGKTVVVTYEDIGLKNPSRAKVEDMRQQVNAMRQAAADPSHPDHAKAQEGMAVLVGKSLQRQAEREAGLAEVQPEKQGPSKPKGRLGRILNEMEEIDRQDNKNMAKVLGISAKLMKDAGGQLNIEIPATQPSPGPTKRRSFSKILKDLDEVNKQDIKNAAQAFGVAADLMEIRKQQVNNQPRQKKLKPSQASQKKLKGKS